MLNRIVEAAARRGVSKDDAWFLIQMMATQRAWADSSEREVEIDRDVLELETDAATVDNFLAALQEVLKNEKH